MKKILWALALIAATAVNASAAEFVSREIATVPGSAGAGYGYLDTTRPQPCLTDAQRTDIIEELKAARIELRARGLLSAHPDKSRNLYLEPVP